MSSEISTSAAVSSREDLLDLCADALVNVAVFHASPAIRKAFI